MGGTVKRFSGRPRRCELSLQTAKKKKKHGNRKITLDKFSTIGIIQILRFKLYGNGLQERGKEENGGCSSVGRVPDCDSGCRGFESHLPPHSFQKRSRSGAQAPSGFFLFRISFASRGRFFLKFTFSIERASCARPNELRRGGASVMVFGLFPRVYTERTWSQ